MLSEPGLDARASDGDGSAVASGPAAARTGLAARAAGVGKTFAAEGGGEVVALDGLSLDVRPGEFVALVGPSGCGKSTFLNLLAGLLRPTSGTVEVHGRRVTGPPPEMGMMFQKPVLLEWRSVRENVLLPLELASGRKAARAARGRADELLGLVGLGGFEGRYPRELSGGMQQRVAICRMLISDPDLLLLDEPFGALDELTREHLNVELAAVVADTTKAALLVTHNIQEAVFLSDRVVVMSARPGRIVGVVDVTLPKPRSVEVVTEAAFQEDVRSVRDLLQVGQSLHDGANDTKGTDA
ncbi:MAG TPA: ABC transporter ATP-binding protein [Acidimicrobiales bacterium]|nr:ABC transporter ATP-binding protein [Acidimicrobiales bacterium]HKH24261.1 ABC transporter ATP-binding protein [Acidimicrobiales bacterium]